MQLLERVRMLEIVVAIISFALTIMVFSYLFGDNFFFKFAMYLLIGISSGYTMAFLLQKVIIPFLVSPLIYGQGNERFLLLVPTFLILLLLLTLFPKLTKAGSLSLAFLVGLISALTIGGVTVGTLIPQLLSTINLFDLTGAQALKQVNWISWVDAIIMLVGIITTLLFFKQVKVKRNRDDKVNIFIDNSFKSNVIGQLFIGITFGALFAGVYSSALMALISRISSIQNLILTLFGS